MTAKEFQRQVTGDQSEFLDRFLALLARLKIDYCVIGGLAANAYAEPVAAIEDLLRGKLWAYQDATRRATKRQKDLVDIARLLEIQPHAGRQGAG